MNFLLLIILAIFVITMYLGYRRGFVKVVLLLCSWLIAMILSAALMPYVSSFLEKNTPVYAVLSENLSEHLKKAAEESIGKDEVHEEIRLPQNLLDTLDGFMSEDAGELLEATGVYDVMGEKLAHILINAISYMIVMTVVMILLRILLHMTDVINKIPVIGGINKVAGLVAGFLQALIISWLICMFISLISESEFGTILYGNIIDSRILTYIYHHNMLYDAILLAMK